MRGHIADEAYRSAWLLIKHRGEYASTKDVTQEVAEMQGASGG
jgi:hypothetical protein